MEHITQYMTREFILTKVENNAFITSQELF